MKNPIPPLVQHQHCEVEIRPSRNAVHRAYYYCLDCSKHIAWISRNDLTQLEKLKLVKIRA